jgi:hypothetical protein
VDSQACTFDIDLDIDIPIPRVPCPTITAGSVAIQTVYATNERVPKPAGQAVRHKKRYSRHRLDAKIAVSSRSIARRMRPHSRNPPRPTLNGSRGGRSTKATRTTSALPAARRPSHQKSRLAHARHRRRASSISDLDLDIPIPIPPCPAITPKATARLVPGATEPHVSFRGGTTCPERTASRTHADLTCRSACRFRNCRAQPSPAARVQFYTAQNPTGGSTSTRTADLATKQCQYALALGFWACQIMCALWLKVP